MEGSGNAIPEEDLNLINAAGKYNSNTVEHGASSVWNWLTGRRLST